jgi:hypothetical protein
MKFYVSLKNCHIYHFTLRKSGFFFQLRNFSSEQRDEQKMKTLFLQERKVNEKVYKGKKNEAFVCQGNKKKVWVLSVYKITRACALNTINYNIFVCFCLLCVFGRSGHIECLSQH